MSRPADVLTADVERTGCSLVGSSAGPSKVQILVGNSRFDDDGVLWAIIRWKLLMPTGIRPRRSP